MNMLGVEAAPFSSADELVLIGPSIRAHVGFDPEYDPKFKQKPFSQVHDVWALTALFRKGFYHYCEFTVDTSAEIRLELEKAVEKYNTSDRTKTLAN